MRFEINNIDSEITVRKFRIDVWGINSSPFVAPSTVRKITLWNGFCGVDTATLLTTSFNMYMDDWLKSVNTVSEVNKIRKKQVIAVFKRGCGWNVNDDWVYIAGQLNLKK